MLKDKTIVHTDNVYLREGEGGGEREGSRWRV
jgi:hypothetical protein